MIVVNRIIVVNNFVCVIEGFILNAIRRSHRGLPIHVYIVDIFHRLKHVSGVVVVIVEQRVLLQSVTVGLWQRVSSVYGGGRRLLLRLRGVFAAARNTDHAKDKAGSNAGGQTTQRGEQAGR